MYDKLEMLKKQWTSNCKSTENVYIFIFLKSNLPQDNDEPIENVETIADIEQKSVGGQFQHHLDQENDGKRQIWDFNHLRIKIVCSGRYLIYGWLLVLPKI